MLAHTASWWCRLVVCCLVILTFVCRTHCAKGRRKLDTAGLRVEKTDGPDDFTNVSDNDKLEQPVPRRVDPQGSWFAFVRHSDRSNRKHQNKNRDRKKKKKSLRGLPGPRGPPGPQGPPGPPGAHITKEVLMKEFKEMVKEEAERRAEKLIAQRCPACPLKTNSSHILPIHDIEELNIIPRVTSGFHVRLRGNVKVSRRTFQELQTFHVPFQEGAFQRGNPFDEKGARFTASREGVYQFTTNLKVQPKHKKKHTTLKRRDTVRVLICIDSLCQKHASLEYISGMESNSRTFTVSLSGMLYMKTGQYTSIHLDNASGMSLVIHAGSDFSGILLGV